MCSISVVMPVYNGAKYLNEAIDSILAQSYDNFEFIIIDDGSTDGSDVLIQSYDDERIVYIKNKINLGIAESLNKGIRHSKGKYIVRMDQDDIAMQNRFEIQYKFMESNLDIGVCGGQAISFGVGRKKKPMVTSSLSHYDIALDLLFKCPFIHPTIFFRKDVLIKNNISYEKITTEDYQLYARLLKYTQFINLPDTLIYYRRHESQLSSNNSDCSSKSVSLVQASVIEAYNFLFNVNIAPRSYLKETPALDSIKGLSQQFRDVCFIFNSVQMSCSVEDKLGKEFLKYCLNWKKGRFARASVMWKFLPVKFNLIYFQYYMKSFFRK